MKGPHLFDARTDGIYPLQDFRKPQGNGLRNFGGVFSLDKRAGLYAVRVVGRAEPIGEHIYQRASVGDLIGASFWEPKSGAGRGIGAWRYITPCVCDDGQDRGPIPEVNKYSSPGAAITPSSREIPDDGLDARGFIVGPPTQSSATKLLNQLQANARAASGPRSGMGFEAPEAVGSRGY